MIRQLMVELTRLRWRRAVLLLLAAAIVVPVVVFVTIAWNTRPVSADEIAAAERQAAEESERPYVGRELRRCVRNPERYTGDQPTEDLDAEQICEDAVLPQPEWFLFRSPLRPEAELDSSAIAVVAILAIASLLIGTTFVGHDWSSGSMSNQLLFEPRRLHVWSAKALAATLAGLVLGAVVLAAYWAGVLLLASTRDIDVSGPVVFDGFGVVLRGTLLAAGAGLGGYALTMLFRSTVATLGLLFAASIAAPLLITLIAFPGYLRALPQNNVLAVIQGGVTITDYQREECYENPGRTPGCEVRISLGDGALYGGALLLLASVPSALSFRRRDVP